LYPVRHHLHPIYCRTVRREVRALKTVLHLLILQENSTILCPNSSKSKSEPLLNGSQHSLDQSKEQSGLQAARLLIEGIEGRQKVEHFLIHTRLVVRRSSSAAA
jgi:hypothetical protein